METGPGSIHKWGLINLCILGWKDFHLLPPDSYVGPNPLVIVMFTAGRPCSNHHQMGTAHLASARFPMFYCVQFLL